MSLSWMFIEDRLGRWQGLNDGATTHFAQNPIGSLAKEIIQNSLDARISDDLPVIVDFDIIKIESKDFPDIGGLKDKISRALNTGRNSQDERTRKALSLADDKISEKIINVLKISEKNTKGMNGPYYEDTSPFYAYTKGAGLSGKEVGLGSFGIGKKAPVVNSAIRTVFVSTLFVNSFNEEEYYCQGMAFWVTDDRDGVKYEGNGYCGDQGNPVTSFSEVPEWLRKSERGTNIYVCCPIFSKEWQELLASSVLTTFFMAIHKGNLEVNVGNYKINKNSIEELFINPKMVESLTSLDDEGPLSAFNSGYNFYRCLTDKNAVILETQIQDPIGNFIVHLLVEENLPKQIGFLRDGMFITSELKAQGLKKFSMTKDFAALAYCGNQTGNAVLREMEPPQHNDFWPNSYSPIEGPKLIKAIGKKIREQLNKHISPEFEGVQSVEFLADFLGIEKNTSERSADGPIDFNPEGRVIHSIKAINNPNLRQKSSSEEDLGEEGGELPAGELENDSDNGDSASGTRSSGEGARGVGGVGESIGGIELMPKDTRVIHSGGGSIQTYFTIDFTGDIVVKFFISGSEIDEIVDVLSTKKGSLFHNGVKIHSNGNSERISLNVKLKDVTNESILVKIYEI